MQTAPILLLGVALFLAHRSAACADERKELLCSNGDNQLTEYVGSDQKLHASWAQKGPGSRVLSPTWLVVFCLVFMLSNQTARADFSCKFDNDILACLPASPVSEDLTERMKRSRILFENKLCVVDEISVSGDADWKPTPYEVRIYVRYECKRPQNESAQSIATPARQTTTARYQFSCALRQYKFFASGFDIHENGTRSHWDSQGTSREIPWQTLAIGNRDTRLTQADRRDDGSGQ